MLTQMTSSFVASQQMGEAMKQGNLPEGTKKGDH
jgi:hypothetical protein